jgi:hypothetical protein
MDELLLVAVPVALVAAVAAFVKPARQRFMPVAKASARAGASMAEVGVAGARGIVDAAIHGDVKPSRAPSGRAQSTSGTTRPRAAQRTPAKRSSGRSRRRPPASATR